MLLAGTDEAGDIQIGPGKIRSGIEQVLPFPPQEQVLRLVRVEGLQPVRRQPEPGAGRLPCSNASVVRLSEVSCSCAVPASACGGR